MVDLLVSAAARVWSRATKPAVPNPPEVAILKGFLLVRAELSKHTAEKFPWRNRSSHTNGRADSTEPDTLGASPCRIDGKYWCWCDY
jgi:hypothetical protein